MHRPAADLVAGLRLDSLAVALPAEAQGAGEGDLALERQNLEAELILEGFLGGRQFVTAD